jgi:hypothetical protein
MVKLWGILGVGSVTGVLLLGLAPAREAAAGQRCEQVTVCADHVYACGQNQNGTIIMCREEVCRTGWACEDDGLVES